MCASATRSQRPCEIDVSATVCIWPSALEIRWCSSALAWDTPLSSSSDSKSGISANHKMGSRAIKSSRLMPCSEHCGGEVHAQALVNASGALHACKHI